MNKKPPELPNIEDATLRACLAPLMDAMNASGDVAGQPVAVPRASRPQPVASGSNDNPLPGVATIAAVDRTLDGCPPGTLAQWRLQAEDDLAAVRMAELFLAMPDAELMAAAAEFPRQIAGTVARIAGVKQRLAARYDKLTAAIAVLERAVAAAERDTD